ncbi:twin-arginine translocation signal domain-containing protein [Haloprofundus sp. MHR1]|uniref:twin-arginine translocation signal domain-containing protein n=1 Tax=Haloprofundus sp. MHR1 TaxID=2572921 RepID=UPI0010BE3EE2|nr:twin-arginine translocation signal domain-containing protein [Haloprofundus sp. MHR1]QCJ47791.1 ABC transporter substrate-binding protein [Haloprofundus sp. MHR1]
MQDEETAFERRQFLTGTAAIAASIGVAGCVGGGDDGDGGDGENDASAGDGSTADGTEQTGQESTDGETGEGGYSVSISPMGEVSFDAVPENAMAYSPQYVDMAVAFGRGETVNSIGFPESFYTGYYDQLDGVEFDPESRSKLWNDGVDKEIFYELDSDVHFIDPTWILNVGSFGLDEADIEEIETNVGPFFANRYSRAHSDPGVDDYEYYTLWELSGKVAELYRETERWEALREVRDELVSELESNLPPESDRPTVGLVIYDADAQTFSPYKIANDGFGVSHYRPLGVRDVFAESDRTYEADYDASYDLEAMLEVDPDVLIHNFDVGGSDRYEAMVDLKDDPVGGELTAMQNDRVYTGGSPLQGPLYNIFQLEMAAKQIYPERFGEWPGYDDDGTYAIPEDERLFDRERVASVVTEGA